MFTPLDVELFILGSFLFVTSLALYLILNYGKPYAIFFYNCFLKPFSGKKSTGRGSTPNTQQDALESFYKGQATIYDATRGHLLKGREEMLALAAAQLQLRAEKRPNGRSIIESRPVWVDIGGGTGYVRMKFSMNSSIDPGLVTTSSYSTNSSLFNHSFQRYTLSTFQQVYVRYPESDFGNWDGQMSRFYVPMREASI